MISLMRSYNEPRSRASDCLNIVNTHLFHDGEDPWFAFFGSIGTNTEIDFLGIRVGLVGRCECENDISGCPLDLLKERGYNSVKVKVRALSDIRTIAVKGQCMRQ